MYHCWTLCAVFARICLNPRNALRPTPLQNLVWGWRLNLSLAAVPALLLMGGAALVPDTPNSLVQRGHEEKGRLMLRKIRGVEGEQHFVRLAGCLVDCL